MEYYKLTELSILADNKFGVLYEISSILGQSGINIEAIVGYVDSRDKSVANFRLVTTDPDTAMKKLSKMQNIKNIDLIDILVVKMEDKPGELNKLIEKFKKAGIDIETVYLISKTKKYAEVAIKPSNLSVDVVLSLLEKEK